MKTGAVFLWSGGKDSAMALHEITTDDQYARYQITGLLTTFTEGYDRVSGHGVRRELIEAQAAAIGLDLEAMYIPQASTMEEYETRLLGCLAERKAAAVDVAAFGDIFLKDVKKRRVNSLDSLAMRSLFPLWYQPTDQLLERFVADGWQGRVICVDGDVLDASWVGRPLDDAFIADLPEGIDPCGENGEFHTFVTEGPIFSEPIRCRLGETVSRDNFHYRELVPA